MMLHYFRNRQNPDAKAFLKKIVLKWMKKLHLRQKYLL